MISSTTIWIILASAVVTYVTRFAGYAVLSRFDKIHPRIWAGLNAVPAAVLAAIVAPMALEGGPAELIALAVAGVLAMRGVGMFGVFAVGAVALLVLRQIIG